MYHSERILALERIWFYLKWYSWRLAFVARGRVPLLVYARSLGAIAARELLVHSRWKHWLGYSECVCVKWRSEYRAKLMRTSSMPWAGSWTYMGKCFLILLEYVKYSLQGRSNGRTWIVRGRIAKHRLNFSNTYSARRQQWKWVSDDVCILHRTRTVSVRSVPSFCLSFQLHHHRQH